MVGRNDLFRALNAALFMVVMLLASSEFPNWKLRPSAGRASKVTDGTPDAADALGVTHMSLKPKNTKAPNRIAKYLRSKI